MTYEYLCQDCGNQWEAEQSIKEKPLTRCPSCGAEAAKRLISGGTGFLLKGGGWYADGYGSTSAGSKPAPSGDAASASGSAESSSGTKSETTKSATSKNDTSKPASGSSSSAASKAD